MRKILSDVELHKLASNFKIILEFSPDAYRTTEFLFTLNKTYYLHIVKLNLDSQADYNIFFFQF